MTGPRDWTQQGRFAPRLERASGGNSDSIEDHVFAKLGPRPRFDPVGNLEHAHIARDINSRAEIEELYDDLHRVEDGLIQHPSPLGLRILLLFLFCIEGVAGVLVMKELGLENPERSALGLMLALFIFFITRAAAQVGRTQRTTGGGEA